MAYRKSKSQDIPSELFILNGELRGVSVPLSEGKVRLGSSSDCDVMLLDAAGDAIEVVITPEDEEKGSYSLEAVTGQVRVGQRTLKEGATRVIPRKSPIKVGSVQMALGSSFENADRARHSHQKQLSTAAWAASLALGLGLLGFWGLSSGSGSVVAMPSPAGLERTYVVDQTGHSQSAIAARELRVQLDQNGFEKLDIFTDQKERMVTVKGKFRRSEEPRWLETFEWFDRLYGKSVYLDVKFDVVDDEITLPFSIEAVWAGYQPRVTLHDGSKRFIGDELPGGWRLNAVTQESVTISKGDETLFVEL